MSIEGVTGLLVWQLAVLGKECTMHWFQDKVISVVSNSKASDNRFSSIVNISGSFESVDVLLKKISSVLAVFSTVSFVEIMVSAIWEDL